MHGCDLASLLDVGNDSLASFGSEFGESLETQGAANSGDVCEHLQALRERLGIAVVEQDYRRQVLVTGNNCWGNMRLGVLVVGREACDGLAGRCQPHTLDKHGTQHPPEDIDPYTGQKQYVAQPRPCARAKS